MTPADGLIQSLKCVGDTTEMFLTASQLVSAVSTCLGCDASSGSSRRPRSLHSLHGAEFCNPVDTH